MMPYDQRSKFFECKIAIISLPISLNMCFGCSKEPPHRDGSFEYSQHMLLLRIHFQMHTLIWKHVCFPEDDIHSHRFRYKQKKIT